MTNLEIEFLKESNGIEGVFDDLSFVQAVYAWDYLIEQSDLTPSVILKTHKILMLHQPLRSNEKGYFRTVPVWVGGREGIKSPRIPKAIEHWTMNVDDLIENGKKESDIFKERLCKTHHVEYEKIHPFVDGNGRTGRMFLNWERLRLHLPLLIIHVGEEQRQYYDWFKE